MKYGYFDRTNREYVITRPDTPTPWINYLGCDDYCALISNTAGGYSFHKDPKEKRISRYRYNNVPADRPGRYMYLRDDASGDHWSATWQPVLKDTKKYRYECRHGMGYTIIKSEYAGIAAETRYYIPRESRHEVWSCTITNSDSKRRSISLFTLAELTNLDHSYQDMNNLQYSQYISRTYFKDSFILQSINENQSERGGGGASTSGGSDVGNTTTLADPSVVDLLLKEVKKREK